MPEGVILITGIEEYGTYPTEEVIGHLRVGDEHKESLRILVSLVQIIHRDALMS